ncbi:transposase (plasmid) [Methylomonas sp. MED-D]|uniref:transposase n=1 Tax=Methylomonas sp. MED-D TaxID=3418768 RepID=UPI003D017699
MILVEIGDDMAAFGSPPKLAFWAGVCYGQNESADKCKSAWARKGNPYLRRILCEAAMRPVEPAAVCKTSSRAC